MQNFWHGFEKQALSSNALLHGAELAGLGILDIPGEKTLRDPNASAREKSTAKYERAGLGVLAVPSLVEAGKGAWGMAKKFGPKLFKR